MTTLLAGLRGWTFSTGAALLVAVTTVPAHAAEPVPVDPRHERTVIVYPVADLLAPSPDRGIGPDEDTPLQATGDALIENLKLLNGRASWVEQDSIVFHPRTQSLVVRASPKVQAGLTGAIEEMRRELSVHIRFRCRVLTGPRDQVGDLASNLDGELGKLETEELEKAAALKRIDLPVVSAFSGQAVSIPYDGRHVVVSAVIAPDRRSVRLKISEGETDDSGKGDSGQLLGASQIAKVRDQASAAFYFAAARAAPSIAPKSTAIERIVLVTPELVAHDEEEELVNVSR